MDDIQRVTVPELPVAEDVTKFTVFGTEAPTNKAARMPSSMIFDRVAALGYIASEEYSPTDYPEI